MVRAYISSGLVTQYEYSEHRLAIVSIPEKRKRTESMKARLAWEF